MQEIDFTPEELEAIRKEYASGATDTQFTLFVSDCKRRHLTPGRHIVYQSRRSKEWDQDTKSYQWVSKPVYITTIAALRLIAQRTGEYAGQGRQNYIYLDDKGNPTIEARFPLPDKDGGFRVPWVVETPIYRKGFSEPVVGIARWDAYAAYQNSDGNGKRLTQMWSTRGAEQLAKCSEADGIRKAFAEDAGGLYLVEELRSDEEDTPKGVTPASVIPLPPPVPKVDQTPAQPTGTPRPNEVSPNPPVSAPVENAPASEKPKRTRKPKEDRTQNEVDRTQNGDGITDEDLANIGTPVPQIDEAANQQAAKEFVEGTDPTPTKEEMDKFVARVRALVAKGKKGDDIKAKLLETAKVDDPKKAPVSVWNKILSEFEAA